MYPRHKRIAFGVPVGFDAPYDVTESDAAAPVTTLRESGLTAAATLVLVDQSATMRAIDPLDQRLFAVKYFLMRAPASSRVALAAFGSDDATSGELSPLPREPVTIFPVDQPAFTTSGTNLFPSVDSLEVLEGAGRQCTAR